MNLKPLRQKSAGIFRPAGTAQRRTARMQKYRARHDSGAPPFLPSPAAWPAFRPGFSAVFPARRAFKQTLALCGKMG